MVDVKDLKEKDRTKTDGNGGDILILYKSLCTFLGNWKPQSVTRLNTQRRGISRLFAMLWTRLYFHVSVHCTGSTYKITGLQWAVVLFLNYLQRGKLMYASNKKVNYVTQLCVEEAVLGLGRGS